MRMANKKVVQINRFRAGGYDGASTGVRTGAWTDSNQGPNTAITSSLNRLRSRSRSAFRNNPYIRKALNSLVSNEIGKGIEPMFSQAQKAAIQPYWKFVSKHFDTDGSLDFNGLQAQVALARRMSGECFVRKRVRHGLTYQSPIQLQVIESEYLDESYSAKRPNGNTIKAGIEFNRRGQRVAYHFWTEHPLEKTIFERKRVRILAKDVIHVFTPTRPGQIRGEPDIAAAIVKSYTLDSYENAESRRSEIRSNYLGFVTRDPNVFESDDDDDNTVSQGSMAIQPGTLLEMLPGEEVNFSDPAPGGEGYDEFMRRQLMAVAAGIGIPYELISNDWRGVNDRLVRSVMQEFRRSLSMNQSTFTHQFCQRVLEWVVDAGVMTGGLALPGYATDRTLLVDTDWVPDAFAYIHPEQDVKARVAEIDNGLISRSRAIRDRGGDADAVDEQRKQDQEREAALGIETNASKQQASAASDESTETGNDDAQVSPNSK